MRMNRTRIVTALVGAAVLAGGAGHRAVYAQAGASGKLVIHIQSNAVGFGSVRVGQRSAPQTITLQNVGTAPMSIDAATIGGTNPSEYSLVSTCGALPVNALCTMSFAFTPSAQGPRTAML